MRDARFSLRLPSDLLDRIREHAERERRAVADVIVLALEDRFPAPKRKAVK
jgi:hypothetical protein